MTNTNSEKSRNKKTIAIVALLLVLVLLLCLGGYTMSKYINSGSGSASASVAKWGYTVTVDTANLFGENYKGNVVDNVTADAAQLEVKSSSTGTNVVAPGTTGSMTIKVEGKAEVASKLTISVKDGYTDVALNLGESTYNPVKWTLNNGTTDEVDGGTLADVVTALKKTETYNPGQEVSVNYTLSWTWAFSGAFDGYNADVLDTALGQIANGTAVSSVVNSEGATVNVTGSSTAIAFELTASIEQIER